MDRILSRRRALKAGLTGVVGAVAGCVRPPRSGTPTPTAVPPTGGVLLAEGFESPAADWETDAHIGPEESLEAFEREVDRAQDRAHAGDWSLRVFTEGDHDDGTAWATRRLSVPQEADRFRVSAQAWSASESFNTLRHLVAFLGPARPHDEGSFPAPGENSTGVEGAAVGGLREPLHQREGWLEYAFEWTPADGVLDSGDLFVAVGVSVVWEADATHFVDDVRVEVLE